jgi:hypothetical protein
MVKKTVEGTLVRTPTHVHIVEGVEASCITDLNGKIPTRIISLSFILGREMVTVIENPMKELMLIEPGRGANNTYHPKTICLAGEQTPEEEVIEASPLPIEIIEPEYVQSTK